ncbi:Hypothetical_protein [Hexamita inflata]|uniref:Hypothetical_protein n=1 Tax=Hexamita inflata TaxID=28002 RepID=A0ABP1GIV0_9EUKA
MCNSLRRQLMLVQHLTQLFLQISGLMNLLTAATSNTSKFGEVLAQSSIFEFDESAKSFLTVNQSLDYVIIFFVSSSRFVLFNFIQYTAILLQTIAKHHNLQCVPMLQTFVIHCDSLYLICESLLYRIAIIFEGVRHS